MGILINTAYLMLVEAKRKPFHGKVLQLGRQSILFSYNSLVTLAVHAGVVLNDVEIADRNARLTDQQFFKALGFTEVQSMEFGTEEHATFVWDLNNPTPPDWSEQFDMIYDGGTLEHIFHIPNAISSVCRMLKVGGRVVHDGGCSGTIDHGFYAIQPTFYHDFYTANEFETNLFSVSKIELANWLSHTGTQKEYVPGEYDYMNCFALSAEHVFNATCFATKLKPFYDMVMPQQSIWSRGK